MAVALAAGLLFSACRDRPWHSHVAVHEGRVAVDTAMLAEGTPVFFSTEVEGRKVDFFLVKTGGEIGSYLDACKKCYRHGKGYRAGSGYVECGYCSVKYPVSELSSGMGSCVPIHLGGRMEGGLWVILPEDIKTAASVLMPL